jgi:LysR family glycine cleavage system transcriptional activator
MKAFLPSTSTLQAFDAAARTGSFTAAARELNMTQSAVSKQIIGLEEHLGVKLFNRRRHAVVLTAAGESYAKDVRAALDIIVSASLRLMANPDGGRLNLAVLPTFGTRWLMPRLPDFLARHPDITVNMMSRLSPFDFRTDGLDAAIHFGAADWPGAACTFLRSEEVVPTCSPGFLAAHPIGSARDFAAVNRLHISSRPDAWASWFRQHGVEVTDSPGMVFEQLLTAAQAAVVGLGVALLPTFLITPELERGDLVVALDQPVRSEHAYYLVVPEERTTHPPTLAFRAWLLATTAAERGDQA